MNWELINKQVGYDARQKIEDILNLEKFKITLYDKLDLDPEKRIALGQFYTPANICIQMLEEFECDTLDNKIILDPCCGSGNLLIACLIAGASITNLYGNDYDHVAVDLCRRRLIMTYKELYNKEPEEFNRWQIHKGDATDLFCLQEFGSDYKQRLEEHYLNEQNSLFPMLTNEQENFLKEID